MSWDDSETVYHLTPSGWKTGDRSPDCVELWNRSVSQASAYSREYVSWSCIWAILMFSERLGT